MVAIFRQDRAGYLAWALLLLGGCGPAPYAPMEGAYYKAPGADLGGLGNVAIITFANHTAYPEIASEVTDIVYVALQRRQGFGIRSVHQDDPVWRSVGATSESWTQPQACADLREALGCNGLLTGEVTQYRPFPHLMIGIRMRLVDLRNARVLWALEQIWDAGDRSTASRIRQYLGAHVSPSEGTMGEHLTAISTLGFLRFVAYEIARTL